MTLKPYDPEMLDQFALRLLDVAAVFRGMARRAEEEQLEDFALHDKKAAEWIGNLERWARRSMAEMEMKIIDQRASARARTAAERRRR